MPLKKPELLAPAGNLEKLKLALDFGADAVFVGGHVFGLRKYADNFTLEELKKGIEYAHNKQKKVYMVLNGFAHLEDIAPLIPHLHDLEACRPDGLIIADMGVVELAKRHTTLPIHISTQASVTNWRTVELLKKAGASRIILAREVTIEDCKTILKHVDVELEVFVHGSMCASYSGKCVISNYTSGRDSNRGGCVQSCRHTFAIQNFQAPDTSFETHVMNAKDLNAISLIPDLIQSGIASFKIEGRMKSNLYVANVVQAYRKAIDLYINSPTQFAHQLDTWKTQLGRVSNRTFSEGGLQTRPDGNSIFYEFGGYQKGIDFIGTVKSNTPELGALIEVKHGFEKDETLHILTPDAELTIPISHLQTMSGTELKKANPNTVVRLSFIPQLTSSAVVFR